MNVTALTKIVIFSIGSSFVLQIKAQKQPNIIFIMADDLGWGDVGFNGNKIIKTPHLDQLANDGIIFDRFYADALFLPQREPMY